MTETTPSIFHSLAPWQQRLIRLVHRHVILIEGSIGCGKSSLVDALAAYLTTVLGMRNVKTAPEDVRAPFLAYFIANAATRAFAFQMTMKVKRKQQQLLAHMQCAYEGATLISDRSEAGDAAFALMHHLDGNISAEEMVVYDDEGSDVHYETPLVAIYLVASEATLKNRIAQRNRPGETAFYTHADPTYLARLECAYEEVMTPERLGCPVVRVPYDDAPLNRATLESILKRVLDACDQAREDV